MTRTYSLFLAVSLPLAVFNSRRASAQDSALTVVATTAVRLRQQPSLTAPIKRVLTPRERVQVTSDTGAREFWPVRTQRGEIGWVHGKYLQPEVLTAETLTSGIAAATTYPLCGGEHYFRWLEKKSTAQQTASPVAASVSGMLAWQPRTDLGHDLWSWCAPRLGRELKTYHVTGWVRTIKQGEADQDWHIELTSTNTTAVTNCIVVEIPDPSYAAEFQALRDKLTSLVAASTLGSTGSLTPPVRLKFTGAAFDDGWHGPHGSMPTAHGHCNSTVGAVWELHPVFKVETP